MTQLFTNNAISLLTSDLAPTDYVIDLIPGDGALFPQPLQGGDWFLVTLEDQVAQTHEIIKCSNRIGDQLIIDPAGRGFENTSIQYWPIDTLVDHRLTAYTLNIEKVNGATQNPAIVNIIPVSGTNTPDIFPVAYPAQLSCKWIITVIDQATFRVSVAEVLACYRGPLQPPMFSVYAKTGDKLKYQISIATSGSNMELNVTNTDTTPLTINWLRLNS